MFGSEPFGQRAVRLGFATSDQVRQALETQSMLACKSGLIGEILVEMGWLNPQDYIKIVQQLTAGGASEGKSHKELQEGFVRAALAQGLVDEERVAEARLIQSRFKRRNRLIGQVMVEMGIISAQECERILETYSQNGTTA